VKEYRWNLNTNERFIKSIINLLSLINYYDGFYIGYGTKNEFIEFIKNTELSPAKYSEIIYDLAKLALSGYESEKNARYFKGLLDYYHKQSSSPTE